MKLWKGDLSEKSILENSDFCLVSRFFIKISSTMGIIKEFLSFLVARKKWILIPVVITLLFIGALIILSSSTAVAPFIYTLF